MKSDKRKIYENLAKKAVNSINFNNKENMLISGVDILDSKKFGNVILEVNPWPDIFDIQKSTNINVFDALAKCFVNKVKNNMNKIKI
jgi:predicted ATP-grasp superfamily ATP-dependent carboligase